MKRNTMLYMVIGLLVVWPAASYAGDMREGAKVTLSLTEDYTPSQWTDEISYGARVREKLIFSSKNTLLGWLELYNEPRDAFHAKDTGVMRGMGHGIVNMLGDTLGGVIQLSTFPITQFDVPLPEGGTDLL